MSSLIQVARYENLARAWKWIRSNPDRSYKGHFRSLYSAYATADTPLLKHLKNRLDRGIYNPSDSCKLFLPKPSGILRPYTLLTIEDQIVYQAMTNVVAEHLHPHVRGRYDTQVFGHQYAGRASLWFYKKWSAGYKLFNQASEGAFNSGYVWTASFDLTAFYDSIDHNVLCHMLSGIGLDQEFCAAMARNLNKWTATSTQIYQNHGIPQGPISSGLISEAVLKHIDENFKLAYDVRYFRYVDDIRLFAKSEQHLRYALVLLDRLSKDIGLFPQSGKIDIHKVKDIKSELKSVSNPPEPALATATPDQRKLRKRLTELAPRTAGYRVSDSTRFKYLVARATPSLRVLNCLWRVYRSGPHFYPQLSQYVAKFEKLPRGHALTLIESIKEQELYPAIRAALIAAPSPSVLRDHVRIFRGALKPLWSPRTNSPDVTVSLWTALHGLQHFTDRQTDYALTYTRSPWTRMNLHFGFPWFTLTKQRQQTLLDRSVRALDADVAIAGAWIMSLLNLRPSKPLRAVNPLAKIVLRESGMLKRADASVCGIALSEMEMCGVKAEWIGRGFLEKRTSKRSPRLLPARVI